MANMHTNYTDILHVKTKNLIIIFKNLRKSDLSYSYTYGQNYFKAKLVIESNIRLMTVVEVTRQIKKLTIGFKLLIRGKKKLKVWKKFRGRL